MQYGPNNHETEDTDEGITGKWFAFPLQSNLVWKDRKKHPEAKPDSELLRRIQQGDF